jgi:hypothetical protein
MKLTQVLIERAAAAIILAMCAAPAYAGTPTPGTDDPHIYPPANPPQLTCYTAKRKSHWFFVNCSQNIPISTPKPLEVEDCPGHDEAEREASE